MWNRQWNGRGSSHSSNGRWPSLTSSTPQSMAFSGDGARSMTTGRPLGRMGRNGWVGWGQWGVTIDGQKGVIILKMDMNNHSKRIWELESILTLLWSFIMYYFDLPRGGDIHWITRTRKQTWLARGLLDGKRIYVLDCQRVWDINDLRWVNGWFIDCSWGHNTQTLSSALGLPWFSWSIHCMGLGSLICTILHLRSRLELRKATGRASGSLGS